MDKIKLIFNTWANDRFHSRYEIFYPLPTISFCVDKQMENEPDWDNVGFVHYREYEFMFEWLWLQLGFSIDVKIKKL